MADEYFLSGNPCIECSGFYVIAIIKNHAGCFTRIFARMESREKRRQGILYAIQSGQYQFLKELEKQFDIATLFDSEEEKMEALRCSISNYSPAIFSFLLEMGLGDVVNLVSDKYPLSIMDVISRGGHPQYKAFLEVYRKYEEECYPIKEPCDE